MSNASARAPILLQPRLKAAPTSVLVGRVVPNNTTPPPLVASNSQRSSTRQVHQLDPISEKATVSLIRRTLCSKSAEKEVDVLHLLPPLTTSNDIDLQLYALISVIIKDFIQNWYTKITEDKDFIDEILLLIAHCTRAVETRLRAVDLEGLLFDELPELLQTHVKIHRIAFQRLHPDPLHIESRSIYHSLWPTPALYPVPNEHDVTTITSQQENEALYCQLLVEGILAVLLPTEDLENGCLTALVGQILSEMIIGNGVGGKACEPWLLWESITKVAELILPHLPQAKAQKETCVANSDKRCSEGIFPALFNMAEALSVILAKTFWMTLQSAYSVFALLWSVIIILSNSATLPERRPVLASLNEAGQQTHKKRPILHMRIWSCVSDLLDLNIRMPWMYAVLSMLIWAAIEGLGTVGRTNGIIDKLLASKIQQYARDPALIPLILRSTRAALFPNNTLGPARQIPSATEQLAIRKRCAECLLQLAPNALQDIYFGRDQERRIREVEDVLDVFGDAYCNKHLIYGIVELIVVRLCPEMTVKGVAELWKDRIE